MAMKYYNQLEVMPIYQAMNLVLWMSGGMIVLNETAYYNSKQLLGIYLSFGVICIGIKVLTLKINKQRIDNNAKSISTEKAISSNDSQDEGYVSIFNQTAK